MRKKSKRIPLSLLLAAVVVAFLFATLLPSSMAAQVDAPGTETVIPSPTPLPEPGSTTGITVMSVVIMVIIVFGFFWGQRVFRQAQKISKDKPGDT